MTDSHAGAIVMTVGGTPPGGDVEDPDAVVREWYDQHYSLISASADGSFFSRYMHRTMERRYGIASSFDRVLEVGGNRAEHLPFVRHGYREYVVSDLFPPILDGAAAADPRVSAVSCDVARLPFRDTAFDRLIATCLLHHVDSPMRAAQEMRRVTRVGGVMTILVPTDPGLAYRFGKAVTSGRAARRAGLAERHRLVAALDHPNHFGSIKEQLRHVFRNDALTIDWWPWRMPSMSLEAFAVFTVVRSC
ncbi:MAG TPA: class I SAM-dependent methyltransferase [Actinomycetes bacterium]|nr:class I SAM-dependent methyltransferase [Actinomycetes bacterium]